MMSSSSPRLFLVIFALAIGSFCIGTTEFLAMGLIQEIAQSLNVSIPSAGYFISAYALGVMIGAPIIAILGARVPRKHLLIGLMLFYGLANGLTALAQSSDMMLLARFISGFPHGAYFGIASLIAAELAGSHRRASAIAQVMMGLTVATVIGVPFATWLGQQFGWQTAFIFASSLAVITCVAVALYVPPIQVQATASIQAEFQGLKNINMWLTLAVGAIGFGGMFAVYSYVSPILTEYTAVNITTVPIALSIFGIGMVLGGLTAGWLADRHLNFTMIGVLVSSAVAFFCAYFMMANVYTAMTALFFIAFTISGLGGGLQIRLMDVAGNAQNLAASLNHSAFNLANALGAFLGAWVIEQQLGWLAPIWVGFGLSLAGLAVLFVAFWYDKRQVSA